MKAKEVNEFFRKARGKSSSGNDGMSYKVYKKLRSRLFLLLREAWQKKIVAEWWYLAEGIYLPKEENSEDLGQSRHISLLNIDGKILFAFISKRIIDYAKKNWYIDESVQKAGLPKIPGCIEHTYFIWSTIQEAKNKNENLSVIWLDVANVYGSVRHRLIEKATENFWFSEELKNMLIQYNNSICMRFSTDKFTTQWQRLEVVLPLDVLFQ